VIVSKPEKVEKQPKPAKAVVTVDTDGDKVMEISKPEKKKKNKKKRAAKQDTADLEGDTRKRVTFDLTKNKVTEFFKHGKVATRVIK